MADYHNATQEEFQLILDEARRLTQLENSPVTDYTPMSDPNNWIDSPHAGGTKTYVGPPVASAGEGYGAYLKLKSEGKDAAVQLDDFAKNLGVDIVNDPSFVNKTEASGGDTVVGLGVASHLITDTYGSQFQNTTSNNIYDNWAEKNIGKTLYEAADTDAFKDKVGPGLGSLLGIAGAALANPLLSMAGTAVGGGDLKDVATTGLMSWGGQALGDFGNSVLNSNSLAQTAEQLEATAKATELAGEIDTATTLYKTAKEIKHQVEDNWDPDKDPSWQDQYEEVLYDGDVLFKDTVSDDISEYQPPPIIPQDWPIVDTVNDDISEYQPPPIIPQDWPIVDTGTGGNGGNNGGSQDIPSDPTEEPVGGIGLPNPLPPIPDDEDPNEPDKKQPSLSFLQLFMDIKGALGDQQAYDGAGDTPITQGMLASNGYADRTPYELFENQPFEKTKRMGDFLYDMET